MSNPNLNTDVNALTPSVTREQFEQERVTRRAMLRRLGLTAGASLFGLMAADDLVRAALSRMQQTEALRGVADTVAVEFKNAGVAFAQTQGGNHNCGVPVVPCIDCHTAPPPGTPPHPRDGLLDDCVDPYCNDCTPPADCDDCMAVAAYAHCNCMQTVINGNPGCFDSNGQPNGTCPQITAPIARCDDALYNAC